MPDIPSKFQKDPSITFRVILYTHRQTDKQTKSGKNITSLAEVIMSDIPAIVDRTWMHGVGMLLCASSDTKL